MDCEWIIHGGPFIEVVILDFEIERARGDTCFFDRLEIIAGALLLKKVMSN